MATKILKRVDTPMIVWTHPSVLAFAGADDPIAAMEERARQMVLEAIDRGWCGPPFDPVQLAQMLKIEIEPRGDIPDARTVPSGSEKLKIEFNPTRPRGRVRFSIAHEIAHTLFPDCTQSIRNRGGSPGSSVDDWQLEVLCNIGAAEITMPTGSFPELRQEELDINKLLLLRKSFDVSAEAVLIRMVKLTPMRCAVFCASKATASASRLRLDYVIASRGWRPAIRSGILLPQGTVLEEANAIGFTAKRTEVWQGQESLQVQCVGLPPYPGSVNPRVAGIVAPIHEQPDNSPNIIELQGDALLPRGNGPHIIAHIVPDSSTAWGGGGFAAALRKRHPAIWSKFREEVLMSRKSLHLGNTFRGKINEDIAIMHMVAQRGIGSSDTPRIRYSSLEKCLRQLQGWAQELHASVHMPRIGAGHAGGSWEIIQELILDTLVREGTAVTIYTLPSRH